MVKSLPAIVGDAGDMCSILDWEDPLEKQVATRSTILVWEMPWVEEPGGLLVIAPPRVSHDITSYPILIKPFFTGLSFNI